VAQLVTPLKPYEAMAMGKPVVASDVPALNEMVIDSETGLLFRPEDADDLTEKIAMVSIDRDLAQRLGTRARLWVAENRSWSGVAALYVAIYEELS
jgi:glycosyltransferase involved in cell wall biosynthesis